jgi:hypothetical protein
MTNEVQEKGTQNWVRFGNSIICPVMLNPFLKYYQAKLEVCPSRVFPSQYRVEIVK